MIVLSEIVETRRNHLKKLKVIICANKNVTTTWAVSLFETSSLKAPRNVALM